MAIAKAFKLEHVDYIIERKQISSIDEELGKFMVALEKSKEELETIKQHALVELGQDKADIFSAHLLILSDPELIDVVNDKIRNEQLNADFALHEVAQMFIAMFEGMDNQYMRERSVDIRDVTKCVLNNLLGAATVSLSDIQEEVNIIAEDLTPSDTSQLNRNFVNGFATDIGG